MSLEAIYYVSQIVAVLAILSSLIFVAIQVRQGTDQIRMNTQALKASASFDAMHSYATLNEFAANLSGDVLTVLLKSYDRTNSWADFSDLEQIRLTLLFRTTFQKLEGQYYLVRFGTLGAELWEGRRDWAASLIQLPFYREWWKREKQEKVYTEAFCKTIEGAVPTGGISIWDHPNPDLETHAP